MLLELSALYIKGAFFWGYSSYSDSGLGITDTQNFNFKKNAPKIWKRNTHGRGDLRTTMPARASGCVGFPAKNFPKERVFCLFRVNHIPLGLFQNRNIRNRWYLCSFGSNSVFGINGISFCSFCS